ncbi:MAG: carbohydrate kinase family protein [Promethearchaeota archaeon]
MDSWRIYVVGELHRDLFYKTDAFTEMTKKISEDILFNIPRLLGNIMSGKDFFKPKDFMEKLEIDKGTIDITQYLKQRILDDETAALELQQAIKNIVGSALEKFPKKLSCEAYIKRGGNGNNSATIMAKFGIPTSLFTVIGEDSEWMLSDLENIGIGSSTIYKKKDPTPISTIVEDPNFTKIFIASNMKKRMNFEGIELPDLRDAFLIFITPMDFKYKHILDVSVLSEKLVAITLELQKISSYDQLKKCVDVRPEFLFCNLDDGLKICESQFDEHLPLLEQYKNKVLEELDLLSKRELESVEVQSKSELGVKEGGAQSDQVAAKILKIEKEYQELKLEKVDRILSKFANVRIYTLGKYGAWLMYGVSSKKRMIYQSIIPVKVKNRTGAGDTFAAGFITKLYDMVKDPSVYKKKSIEEKVWIYKVCLLFASASAALKVSTGESPSRDEVIKLLDSLKSNK